MPAIPSVDADPALLTAHLLALRDIAAQEGMARWAEYLLYVGILQVVLAAAGAIALVITIQQTRQANRIAQQASILSQRAWLSTGLQIDGPLHVMPNGSVHVNVSIYVENIGRSPALNVHTSVTLCFDVLNSRAAVRLFSEKKRQRQEEWGRVCLPGENYLRPWSPGGQVADNEAHINVLVIGCVTYDVAGDKALHQTQFAYLVSRRDGVDLERGQIISPELLQWDVWTGGHAD